MAKRQKNKKQKETPAIKAHRERIAGKLKEYDNKLKSVCDAYVEHAEIVDVILALVNIQTAIKKHEWAISSANKLLQCVIDIGVARDDAEVNDIVLPYLVKLHDELNSLPDQMDYELKTRYHGDLKAKIINWEEQITREITDIQQRRKAEKKNEKHEKIQKVIGSKRKKAEAELSKELLEGVPDGALFISNQAYNDALHLLDEYCDVRHNTSTAPVDDETISNMRDIIIAAGELDDDHLLNGTTKILSNLISVQQAGTPAARSFNYDRILSSYYQHLLEHYRSDAADADRNLAINNALKETLLAFYSRYIKAALGDYTPAVGVKSILDNLITRIVEDEQVDHFILLSKHCLRLLSIEQDASDVKKAVASGITKFKMSLDQNPRWLDAYGSALETIENHFSDAIKNFNRACKALIDEMPDIVIHVRAQAMFDQIRSLSVNNEIILTDAVELLNECTLKVSEDTPEGATLTNSQRVQRVLEYYLDKIMTPETPEDRLAASEEALVESQLMLKTGETALKALTQEVYIISSGDKRPLPAKEKQAAASVSTDSPSHSGSTRGKSDADELMERTVAGVNDAFSKPMPSTQRPTFGADYYELIGFPESEDSGKFKKLINKLRRRK